MEQTFEEIIEDEKYLTVNKPLINCVVCDIYTSYERQLGKYENGVFVPSKTVIKSSTGQILFYPNDRSGRRFHYIDGTDEHVYNAQFKTLDAAKRYVKTKVFSNSILKYKYYFPNQKPL